MDDVTEKLFEQLRVSYAENNKVSDDILLAFNFLLPNTMQYALDLIDKNKITLFKSKSGRSVYQVIGSSNSPYMCLVEGMFCECPAFKYLVIKSGESLLCKHLLAIKLSQAINRHQIVEISEDKITNMLKSID